LLAHHHEPGGVLVAERREAEQAVRLGCVGRVERPVGEDERVGERLPRDEEHESVAEPEPLRQSVAAGRVDQLRPDEHAAEDERAVLERVQRRALERPIVERRHVPDCEGERPDSEGDGGAQQRTTERAQRP